MLEEETGEIKLLRQNPDLSECAAEWFSQKWNVPLEAYRESIRSCVENEKAIPQWYVVTDRKQRVIAGAGVIENDFHDFPQCLCAVCGAALPRTGNCQKAFEFYQTGYGADGDRAPVPGNGPYCVLRKVRLGIFYDGA